MWVIIERNRAFIISHVSRIIVAISKHVMAQEALAGAYESVGIEESADLGVVISALEIVARGFSIV